MFYAGWLLVGRVDTLKKAGDYFCIDLIDEPLVITRNKEERQVLVCYLLGNSAYE